MTKRTRILLVSISSALGLGVAVAIVSFYGGTYGYGTSMRLFVDRHIEKAIHTDLKAEGSAEIIREIAEDISQSEQEYQFDTDLDFSEFSAPPMDGEPSGTQQQTE